MLHLSARSHLGGASNPLTLALAAHRAAGRPVWDLTASNPTTVGLAWPAEALAAALAAPENTTYQPAPRGLASARAAVGAADGVDPERVVLTASTSEGYSLLFKVLCDPGDDVLALTPGYPLFAHLAAFEGVGLRTCPLAWDGAWHLDRAAIRAAIGPRTRSILLVNPNNPTGHYLRPAELELLAELGLPLVVDEVFCRYVHDGPAFSARARLDLPLVVLDGLSKRVGLPQAKAGWLVVGGPPALADPLIERLEGVADAFLSIATPVQHGLATLLADAPGVGQAIQARTAAHLAHLRTVMAGSPVQVHRVEGGWYAIATLPQIMDDEAWALTLLAAGVLVQPGYFYDFSQRNGVVLSLLTPPHVWGEGVARLRQHVEALVA